MANRDLRIAIIGMSGEFPGAKNMSELWQTLIDAKESITTLSDIELKDSGVSEDVSKKKNYVPRAASLEGIDLFAADFFGYSPREAAIIDPQQRKLLEHAWHAFEDAAINPMHYEGLIGVFVGSSLNTYLMNNILSHPKIGESDDIQQILFGNGPDYLATRIAYQLNCRGPALNIQTACSTSLVAIHEACQQLLSYQVDVALAGGVSISVPQKQGYLYSVDGILSPDGHCRPFSNEANGTVFGSGLGVVILKRLEDALEDGNPIYAVINGSAVNNDGHQKVGYTAPSVEGQAEVIALAQASAGLTVDEIGYIEAHGTGTFLGDPIELTALQQVFSDQTDKKQFCALGSLKSNIGHLDVAAGVAGLMKTVLVLQHQQIPKTLNCIQPSTKFDWSQSAFYVNSQLEYVDFAHAAVSCFGIGGTNAHVVLGRFTDNQNKDAGFDSKPVLLIFSAKTAKALQAKLEQFWEYSDDLSACSLNAIARTLQQGRVPFRYRAAFVVTHLDELLECIKEKKYEIRSCEQELGYLSIKSINACNKADLTAIANSWLAGHQIDWNMHYSELKPRMVHLPLYPFEKSSYWFEPYQPKKIQEKLAIDDWFYQPSWKLAPLSCQLPRTTTASLLVLIHPEMASILDRSLFSDFGTVIYVYAGDHFEVIDSNTFSLQISEADHFIALLEQLHKEGRFPQYLVHALTLTLDDDASTVEVFTAHQSSGLMSVLYLIQAYEKVFKDQSLQLTVLTNRLNKIAEGPIAPHKSPVLAAVKVIPKEYRKVQMQLVDVDFIDYPQNRFYQIKQLIQEISKPIYDQEEIVLRGISRWLRTYTRTPIHSIATKPFSMNSSRVIFIVGGLGQLGLDIADYFSQLPGVKLALISRKKLPNPEEWVRHVEQATLPISRRTILERLIKMQARGCLVQTFAADISHKDSIAQIIDKVEQNLGPINGVIHAAGETVNGIISMKTQASLTESYQAKVYGSYHLCELFANKSLDFMMLCSSMNAVIGGLGQLDNTAANSFIDYLAQYQAAKTGQPILSINWGAINMDRPLKVNVVPQFIDLSTEHKRNRMNDHEVAEVYTRLLTHHLGPRVVISTLDMDDVLLNWNRVASIEDLDKEIGLKTPVQSNLLDEEKPKTKMEDWIAQVWSRILGRAPIGREANFFDLGGDSLSAVQFVTRILEQYQVKLHVMTLYEIPVLNEFARHIEQTLVERA